MKLNNVEDEHNEDEHDRVSIPEDDLDSFPSVLVLGNPDILGDETEAGGCHFGYTPPQAPKTPGTIVWPTTPQR